MRIPDGARVHRSLESTSPFEQCWLPGQQSMMRGGMLVWRRWRRSQVVSLLVAVGDMARARSAGCSVPKPPPRVPGEDQSTCGASCPIGRRGMKISRSTSMTLQATHDPNPFNCHAFFGPCHTSYVACIPLSFPSCHRQLLAYTRRFRTLLLGSAHPR